MSTVFVSNLSFKTTPEDFQKHFESFGTVKKATLITRKGYSKGRGFIEYETEEQAQKAIASSESEFEGRPVRVELARPKEERKPRIPRESKKTNGPRRSHKKTNGPRRGHKAPRKERETSENMLVVRNLSYEVTEEELKEAFKEVSPVNVTIIKRRSGKSKGFGFIEVKGAAEQEEAIKKMNEKELKGRKISVQKAFVKPVKPERKLSENVLRVKNLNYALTEEEFKEAFKEVSPVNVTIIKRRSGKSKGFGFIEVKGAAEQEEAIKKMNEKELKGRKMFISKAYVRPEKKEN